MNLFQRFINTKRGLLYCRGKTFRVIKAACDYVQGLADESKGENNRRTQYELAMKYNISASSIRRHYKSILTILKEKNTRLS